MPINTPMDEKCSYYCHFAVSDTIQYGMVYLRALKSWQVGQPIIGLAVSSAFERTQLYRI